MDPAAAALLPLLFILFVMAMRSIRQVNQWQVALRFTLGKFTGRIEPGITLLLPFFQQMVLIDTRIRNRDLPAQMVITKDNVSAMIDAVVYYKVVDPEKATLNVENYETAVRDRAKVVLRDIAGETTLDELLQHREEIAAKVRLAVEEFVAQWGLHVELIAIQDIQLPQMMQEVIAKKAIAERERQFVIIKSQADVESAKNFAEAARILTESPGAMELRRSSRRRPSPSASGSSSSSSRRPTSRAPRTSPRPRASSPSPPAPWNSVASKPSRPSRAPASARSSSTSRARPRRTPPRWPPRWPTTAPTSASRPAPRPPSRPPAKRWSPPRPPCTVHRADHPDADALLRAAVAAAPDPRLRSMLATAVVTVAPENKPWAASHGSVQGYAVAVALCAEDLAAVDASHSLRDQLVRAFAAAVVSSRHHALSSVATRWNRRVHAHTTTYRDVAHDSAGVTLAEGLRCYLGADAGTFSAHEEDEAVTVRAPSTDRGTRPRVEAALRSMLGPKVSVRWG